MLEKSDVYVEFEGKNTEEAINKASEVLNISQENLNFTIITMGSKGFLGFGSKNAVISVNTEKNVNVNIKTEQEKRKSNFKSTTVKEDKRESNFKSTVIKEEKNKKFKINKIIEPSSSLEKTEFVLDWNSLPQANTLPGANESFFEGQPDEVMLEAQIILNKIITQLNITAEIEVKRIDRRIILNLKSNDAALLIGKKGSTLDALQFLVNKIIARKLRKEEIEGQYENNRVIVDAEGYKARRHHNLLETTEKLANKVLKTSRPSTLSNLNAQERRLIHLALQNTAGLYTKSQGSGLVRNLVILPAKNIK